MTFFDAFFVTAVAMLVLIGLIAYIRSKAALKNDTLAYQASLMAFGSVVFTVLATAYGAALWPKFLLLGQSQRSRFLL